MHDQRSTTTDVDVFTIGRCDACGALLGPDASACSSCRGTEISRRPCCGDGTIVSWTVVEVFPDRTCTDVTPHAIAIVALDEGPWTYAWIEEALPEPCGKIRVRYDRMTPGEPYPLFVQR
ncbi:putative OB-fold protein [Rhodococcus sp. LBL1]|uniref:OB-fold protein n=1 Tax=Prescottella agglutinans TaxID=1644129 RepID=A0ABT6MJC1_9NOCA|nr:OB-fold domain-containing protein [Prescottella agglutinans]MDH6284392.1 putative OB-fold protein [Prescottella agglutinans]MDH6680881.1 putative OB-fold protein [Rhodococcus sp. LBL1]MDH6686185.1 putative OB-fold protein [Rhodococcus sp. LBL2]